MQSLPNTDALPSELRDLVKNSVADLGRVIERECGEGLFLLIETLRQDMVSLRGGSTSNSLAVLRSAYQKLTPLKSNERETVARAFTLMLELMNACENAYRSYRLAARSRERLHTEVPYTRHPDAIVYVLTAHPTEARSPQNISIFHEIQRILVRLLAGTESRQHLESELFHQLEIAWRVAVVRDRSPEVSDEADHIYSTLFGEGIIDSLLDSGRDLAPIYIRSWVGGDKDGHPGVDERTLKASLSLSRQRLLAYVAEALSRVQASLMLLPKPPLQSELRSTQKLLSGLRTLKLGDGARVEALRAAVTQLESSYIKSIGAAHPNLRRLNQLLRVFPGLVVPLELREASDVLMESEKNRRRVAIDRMLDSLADLGRGGDPRWYARGFIISMASKIEHVRAAHAKVLRAFGRGSLPVIPLFEQKTALEHSSEIVFAMMRDRRIGKDIRTLWNGRLEVMVGYSDSAKESGVLASRLAIAEAMNHLDTICEQEGVRPLFFQGSGGSVDRGGGSIQDQTAWWPRSALSLYKVTIQGEMVERSLASPEITRGQIERIAQSAGAALSSPAAPPHSEALKEFAAKTAAAYAATIASETFLRVVERGTPYLHLSDLKIGSRPTSRQSSLSVAGLRAIPWVLCWTQTRVLFPTWWGTGRAWTTSSAEAKSKLQAAFRNEPVFASYVRALGFTLAKVELSVWRIYLEQSGLEGSLIEQAYSEVQNEYQAACDFLHDVTGEKDLVWFRPWLAASIGLRSAMIHPLNLLQVLAMRDRDAHLLRLTVTGVSSGMLTTG
ncbi:MAG: phosphoenolpyruvate carboxylase [Bdellovibrionales bacterium]|nr:phosphoenolpyruvate carboxylase [Bdellovibrionales bacterium]